MFPSTGFLRYIEDLFEISAPTSREMSILKEDVYAVGLNSKDTYIGHLKQAGFSDIQVSLPSSPHVMHNSILMTLDVLFAIMFLFASVGLLVL